MDELAKLVYFRKYSGGGQLFKMALLLPARIKSMLMTRGITLLTRPASLTWS